MSNTGTFGQTSPGEPPHWRDEPITQKQKMALFNMANCLHIDYVEPKTKGEAADMIDDFSKKMEEMKENNYYRDEHYPFEDKDW